MNRGSINLLAQIFRKGKAHSSQNELITGLNEVANKLGALNADTEEDFLTIGDNLQNFSRRVREISETSATVADLMTGAEINAAIDKLNQIFNRIADLGGEFEDRIDALKKIILILNGVEQSISGFRKIVKTLSMLGVFTRVESAHVGNIGADFSVLAIQVNELAKDIEAKSSKILSQSQSLAALIQENLTNVSTIKELQRDQIHRMVQNINASLNSLKEKHTSSSSLSNNIADRYKLTCNNIDHIVTLLQFHDITRQQIDHVKEAIFALASNIQELSGNGTRKRLNNADN